MDPGGWQTFVHCVHTTWTFAWLQSVLPGGGAVCSSGALAGKSFSSSVHLAVASCLQTAVESYGTRVKILINFSFTIFRGKRKNLFEGPWI